MFFLTKGQCYPSVKDDERIRIKVRELVLSGFADEIEF